MPRSDGTLERRIRAAAPRPDAAGDMLERLVARKHRRAVMRKVGTIAAVVVLIGGTLAAFAAVGAGPATQPAAPSPSQSDAIGALGHPYPVCDLSTMPLPTEKGQGSAAVFARADDGCPQEFADKTVGVGVDLNGDGTLDATTGAVPDCFIRCEAFAVTDLNNDGVPEIAVSNEGADGYGVYLYAITTSPPSIAPITKDGDPFQFAWAAVAAHADAAHCELSDRGEGTLVLTDATFEPPDASVDSVSFSIEGTIATKTGQDHTTVPLDTAPEPTDQLCGAPIHGSARGVTG
jgi:hypothetical protein